MNNISLQALARLAGINGSYRTFDETKVNASHQTIAALLEGMGFPASTRNQIRDSYARIARRRRAALPSLIVANPDETMRIFMHKRTGAQSVEWRLTREDGSTTAGLAQCETRGLAQFFQIPTQPQGYHVIEALGASAHLICAPTKCWFPDCFSRGAKPGASARRSMR